MESQDPYIPWAIPTSIYLVIWDQWDTPEPPLEFC